MAANHHSHTGPLLLRPLPLPGELPHVQARHVGQQPLGQIVPGKPYDSYGFVSEDQLEYSAPESYIRWVQPIESELDKQVEYDMDACDAEWLDLYNAERAKTGEEPVPPEVFEIIMDRLEKEWFDLNSRIPKASHEASDGICEICNDGEAEQSNAIVFCDGCNLSVHQDCYGVPYIPADQWLCRKCTVSPSKPVSCCLCPNEGGAFKQTTSGTTWAHLLCALFIPEVGVCNSVYMEPIDGIENISKSRWRLTCYLCKQRTGACMQCYKTSCTTSFHATCAREYGLTLEVIKGEDTSECKGWCHRHKPVQSPLEEEEVETPNSNNSRSEWLQTVNGRSLRQRTSPPPPERRVKPGSNQAYAKSFVSTGPPIIPEMIASNVYNWLARIKLKRKRDVCNAVCRYWSLKRESRRGAGFLKRLHLEPWTAKAQRGATNAEVDEKKLDYMQRLRRDLENVRMLCEHVKKRERLKQRRIDEFRKAVEPILFPMEENLWQVLDEIGAQDKEDLFLQPVTRAMAPDYHDIIKKPVDWMTIGNRLQKHQYLTIEAFKSDVRLVFANALVYNRPESLYHRAALRLQTEAEPILSKLDHLASPQQQACQAVLLALLTQERINALFDLSKTLELPGEEGLPENMRLTDSTEAEAAVPRGDVPRRPKNKRDRLQEQKEKQARLEAEVAERARREAEAAAKVEEERLRLEQEEVRKQAEEADRLKAEQRKQAREAANEKKRIEKEKKRISRDRYRARKRQEKLDALANPSSAPPVPAPVERPNTRRKGADSSTPHKGSASSMRQRPDRKIGDGLSDASSSLSELSELSDVSGDESQVVANSLTPAPRAGPSDSSRIEAPTTSASRASAPQVPPPMAPTQPIIPSIQPSENLPKLEEQKPSYKRKASLQGQQIQQRSSKKKKFEADAPTTEQLATIELPQADAAPHKVQEARLKALKQEYCCASKILNDGDQVWAYLQSYPSWPAQVVVDEGTIPAGFPSPVKVVFFDEGRQTAELMTSKLHVLGESVELDALMLACPSYKKKDSKSRAKMLEQLRRAYRSAKWNWQERELTEDLTN